MEIQCVKVGDSRYPKKLLNIPEKPKELYYLGNLPREDVPSVAMIGARGCSAYGKRFAGKIAKELSNAGVQIISGMARGIDTRCQEGALEGKSPTFAVLGCGVDLCYPEENQVLYEKILEQGGGILSEYPPGDKPLAWHFPQRNRIISGLSELVVVIEARVKSGSLITVEWALEQGKDIMALPGRVDDPLSEGCNRLIKSGAGSVMEPGDILEALHWEWKGNNEIQMNGTGQEALILEALGSEMKNLEEIMERTKLNYKEVMSALFQLQRNGFVEQPMEGYFLQK